MLAINGQMLHGLTYVSKQSSVSLYRGSGQPNDGIYSFNCVGVAFVSDVSKVHLQTACVVPQREMKDAHTGSPLVHVTKLCRVNEKE